VSCYAARADGRAFSLRAVNRMFSFAALFTACTTLCVIRYDHLVMKLGPDVQEWKFNHGLWTSISHARICKPCIFFLTYWPAVCSAFIQCGGELATNLRAVRYRARANWIEPEPDSVLRSVRLLHFTISHTRTSHFTPAP